MERVVRRQAAQRPTDDAGAATTAGQPDADVTDPADCTGVSAVINMESLINTMDDALAALSSGEFRAAILTGAGRGFCAGADLSGTGEAWTKTQPQTPAFKVS